MKLVFFILAIVVVSVSANCGCLKCSKDLRVVSPSHLPIKVIYRGEPCIYKQALPYTIQRPVLPPAPPCVVRDYDLKIEEIPLRIITPNEPNCEYPIDIQAPILPQPPRCKIIDGLVAGPDRVVLPAPDCEPPIVAAPRPIPSQFLGNPSVALPQYLPYSGGSAPIFEKISGNICNCLRYGTKTRSSRIKRDLPMKNSINFLMDLLPSFLREPLQKSLKLNKKPIVKPILHPSHHRNRHWQQNEILGLKRYPGLNLKPYHKGTDYTLLTPKPYYKHTSDTTLLTKLHKLNQLEEYRRHKRQFEESKINNDTQKTNLPPITPKPHSSDLEENQKLLLKLSNINKPYPYLEIENLPNLLKNQSTANQTNSKIENNLNLSEEEVKISLPIVQNLWKQMQNHSRLESTTNFRPLSLDQNLELKLSSNDSQNDILETPTHLEELLGKEPGTQPKNRQYSGDSIILDNIGLYKMSKEFVEPIKMLLESSHLDHKSQLNDDENGRQSIIRNDSAIRNFSKELETNLDLQTNSQFNSSQSKIQNKTDNPTQNVPKELMFELKTNLRQLKIDDDLSQLENRGRGKTLLPCLKITDIERLDPEHLKNIPTKVQINNINRKREMDNSHLLRFKPNNKLVKDENNDSTESRKPHSLKTATQNKNLEDFKQDTQIKQNIFEHDQEIVKKTAEASKKDGNLEELRQRIKRSLVFDDGELALPFFKITDIEGLDVSDEELLKNLPKFLRVSEVEDNSQETVSDEIQENIVSRSPHGEFLKPLHFGHLVPHNPIFYLLNTPIRLLHHFHQFGQQIKPVFRSVPHIVVSSKKYIREFGRNFKKDMLDIASNLIGDFDPSSPHKRRYRRSLNGGNLTNGRQLVFAPNKGAPFEPEYTLAFDSHSPVINSRSKRYILKVVDEDEIQEFLQDKLGDIGLNTEVTTPKSKSKSKSNDLPQKRKLVVEQLTPRIILDNNGRPFFEINGTKRPLLFKKSQPKSDSGEILQKKSPKTKNKLIEDSGESQSIEEEPENDIATRIDNLIVKAKQKIDTKEKNLYDNEISIQIIKEKISEILDEVQSLIAMDLEKYSKIHTNLSKLQNFKTALVKEWKNFLIVGKSNDLTAKIKILDEFKQMQKLKDETVKDIASVLGNGSSFMMKKLIKLLVRLQKLQCIIYMVVEDFSERLKTDTNFDVRKQIKFVDYLDNLHFIVQRSVHEMEHDLKKERDHALDNELKLLERLRKFSDSPELDPAKTYEEAKILWEIKNIAQIQKNIIDEMNTKIGQGLKVRKELKILFDMLRQLENCEERQKKLLGDWAKTTTKEDEEIKTVSYPDSEPLVKSKRIKLKPAKNTIMKNKHSHTIIEDKKPITLFSNGYRLKAYKLTDNFS